MSAYKMIAYHCRNCGGNTDPEKEYCDFCSGQLMLKKFINSHSKMKKLRLLIDCDNDYVNFDTIRTIETEISHPRIEVEVTDNMWCSRYVDPIKTQGIVSTEMPCDKRSMFLLSKINKNKPYKIRIEYPYEDICFDFKGYPKTKEIEYTGYLYETPTIRLDLIQDSEMKMYDGIIPKNAYCPNCYAPITSRYGCCDYCGGWVEWVW